jgi:TPR repeat protein
MLAVHAETSSPAPESGSVEALFDLGLRYANGLGVAQNFIEAHKWFNIAAARGLAEARAMRAEISEDMSRAEIEEAQRQAREWLRLH